MPSILSLLNEKITVAINTFTHVMDAIYTALTALHLFPLLLFAWSSLIIANETYAAQLNGNVISCFAGGTRALVAAWRMKARIG